ncbi:MAG: hypothetical protein D3910_17290 [Candidatus Electrothrix sp. ATG2]|nr:hypothetical protein [Candidatus Electrothrix sp. ATG2]
MGIASVIFSVLIIGGFYYFLWKARDRNLIERFTLWLIFSVTLALAPLIFNALVVFISGKTPTLDQLLKNGELLIITVAIGADAMGKLFGSGSARKLPRIAAGGGTLLLVLVSSLLFSAVTTSSLGAALDPDRIALLSGIMFLSTIITGGTCTLLAATE